MKNNCLSITGNLGHDPETKTLSGGGTLVILSVATSETWKDTAGDPQRRVDWHKVKVFDQDLGKTALDFKKGDLVNIEGSMQYSDYEKDGVKCRDAYIAVRRFDKVKLLATHGLKSNPKPINVAAPAVA